jgi:SEC-C motif-containing protein
MWRQQMLDAQDALCPCGSGRAYTECCGPLHDGTARAPSAVALMRSRFSAFARGRADYLLHSWHPSTRPARLDLDDAISWRRLQIVDTEAGGADDTAGVVEFRAQYEKDGKRHILRERSRFRRSRDGSWQYVDGDIGS